MRLTPDGLRYLRLASGEAQPLPFHFRWLLPTLLGTNATTWRVVAVLTVVGSGALTAVLGYQHGLGVEHAVAAGAMVALLPSMRFQLECPVLVDAPAMFCALASAVVFPYSLEIAVLIALIGGMVSEKVPLLAALFAWQLWPLAGLAAPLLMWIWQSPAKLDPSDPHSAPLAMPFRCALESHAGRWRDPLLMVAPWGACLAALFAPSPMLGVALLVGYAQLLMATDSVRLYQAVSPVVAIAAAGVIPMEWLIPAVAAHAFNPLMGDGI